MRFVYLLSSSPSFATLNRFQKTCTILLSEYPKTKRVPAPASTLTRKAAALSYRRKGETTNGLVKVAHVNNLREGYKFTTMKPVTLVLDMKAIILY